MISGLTTSETQKEGELRWREQSGVIQQEQRENTRGLRSIEENGLYVNRQDPEEEVQDFLQLESAPHVDLVVEVPYVGPVIEVPRNTLIPHQEHVQIPENPVQNPPRNEVSENQDEDELSEPVQNELSMMSSEKRKSSVFEKKGFEDCQIYSHVGLLSPSAEVNQELKVSEDSKRSVLIKPDFTKSRFVSNSHSLLRSLPSRNKDQKSLYQKKQKACVAERGNISIPLVDKRERKSIGRPKNEVISITYDSHLRSNFSSNPGKRDLILELMEVLEE